MSAKVLFACSKCFSRHPYEELSSGQQLCKVNIIKMRNSENERQTQKMQQTKTFQLFVCVCLSVYALCQEQRMRTWAFVFLAITKYNNDASLCCENFAAH